MARINSGSAAISLSSYVDGPHLNGGRPRARDHDGRLTRAGGARIGLEGDEPQAADRALAVGLVLRCRPVADGRAAQVVVVVVVVEREPI
jgi:hypothetical protein